MRSWASRRCRWPAIACVAWLAACSGAPPKPPEPVARALEIHVEASSKLNPDAHDRPAPVVVRIYELRSPLSFESADFFALFDKDQSTLGNDLVARSELQMLPGRSVDLSPRELKPEVRAIGVFAVFRDLEHARWRAMTPLPEPPPPVTEQPPKPLGVPVRVVLGARDVRVSAP